MDVLNLLGGRRVEVDDLLSRWGAGSGLIIGVQAGQDRVGSLGNTIGLIDRLGLVGGMIFLVQVGEGRQEAVGDTMLAVKVDGPLESLIAENITVGNVLCSNTGSWLLLLGELIAVSLSILSVMLLVVGGTMGAGDLDVGGTKLGVVEEKGGLSSSFLLEGDRGTLRLARRSDIDGADLTTEGEEV